MKGDHKSFCNYLLYMVIIIIIITIVTSIQIMIWRRCVKLGNRDIKIHVYANGKREFVPRDQVFPLIVVLN